MQNQITVRLGKLAETLETAAEQSRRTESEIVRAAVAEFLARHDSPEAINAAVVAVKEAA